MPILLSDVESERGRRLAGNSKIHKGGIPSTGSAHVECHEQETAHHVDRRILQSIIHDCLLCSGEQRRGVSVVQWTIHSSLRTDSHNKVENGLCGLVLCLVLISRHSLKCSDFVSREEVQYAVCLLASDPPSADELFRDADEPRQRKRLSWQPFDDPPLQVQYSCRSHW
jgi:hypothetical protein